MVWKDRKKKRNYANHFAAVLFVALVVNLALYGLPDSILGLEIKKVDLLSDLREAPQDNVGMVLPTDDEASPPPDNSPLQVPVPEDSATTQQDVIPPPPVPADSEVNGAEPAASGTETDLNRPGTTSAGTGSNDADYLSNTLIEDFSTGHTGLRRFFAALNHINHLKRPVRIAFLGDSFIEGDILVADFRAKMQEQFGGRGVGFIPITSNVAQYRPTIKQSAGGWKTYSIIKNKNRRYVLSGLLFEPESDRPSMRFQMVDLYPGLEEVSSLKFIYSGNVNAGLLLKSDGDTSYHELPPAKSVTQYEISGKFTKGTMQFRDVAGLQAIGVAFEDDRGVVVDNFSLRSNSGIIMSELDGENCRSLQRIRPYDLIIMQYGLNVASDSISGYGWYSNHMISVIGHIRDCFPGADILILGVSDRSHKRGGEYRTMPAVLSLLQAQRRTARETGVTFWSTFAAMGGRNSMIKYVNSNWASKDYTHLNFRGGREIAQALFDAIITERKSYNDDYDERLVE
jgi:hypothetical protein